MPKYNLKDEETIEKSDFTHEFTISSILESKAKYEKMIIEIKAQITLDEAKMHNIKEHHPYVLELGEEKRNAVELYERSAKRTVEYYAKLKEIEEVIKEYDEVAEDIKKQTGKDIYAK